MEPCDAGPGAALEETRQADLGDAAPHSHLSPPILHPPPLLYTHSVCCLAGAGGLHLPAGAGEGLLWLTHRKEPALFHLPYALQSPGVLLKCTCRISRSGYSPRFCISDKLPGDASTASQHTALIGRAFLTRWVLNLVAC